jgi:hypothetical protein
VPIGERATFERNNPNGAILHYSTPSNIALHLTIALGRFAVAQLFSATPANFAYWTLG